jgi:hypothetical protein
LLRDDTLFRRITRLSDLILIHSPPNDFAWA